MGHIRQLPIDHNKGRRLKHGVAQYRPIEVAGIVDIRTEINFEETFHVDGAGFPLRPQARGLQSVRRDLFNLCGLVPEPTMAARIGYDFHLSFSSRSSGTSFIRRLMTSGATLRSESLRNKMPACGFRLR